jgi:hypothetical protein
MKAVMAAEMHGAPPSHPWKPRQHLMANTDRLRPNWMTPGSRRHRVTLTPQLAAAWRLIWPGA